MSESDLQNSLDDVLPQRYDMGYRKPSYKLTCKDIPDIINAVAATSMIYISKMELDNFIDGVLCEMKCLQSFT